MEKLISQSHVPYQAAVYARLSKEDGDVSDAVKLESNSISNQKQLIKDFLKTKEDIEIVSVYVDDGYTGSNFNRPAFQMMMKDIENGIINCVVVKDLSRFGREYIDAGNYIEKVFPSLGVRFIAINNNYDSKEIKNYSDGLTIPFMNLVNDWYCADIAGKIRSHLTVKRKSGQFIGAFAPYGYQKDEKDNNHLVIDVFAAGVVNDIFNWTIQGISIDAIADKLNQTGILSPLEYKNSLGYRFTSGYKMKEFSQWSNVTIRRILQNEVYTGTLVQGRKTTPNHKVKKVIYRDKADWIRVENTHEAIIPVEKFQLVQKLLAVDTRKAPMMNCVYPLSGVAVCADCGSLMTRKTSVVGGKKYAYYICSANKKYKTCSSHRIPEAELEKAVQTIIQKQVQVVLNMEKCMSFLSKDALQTIDIKKLMERKALQEKKVEKYNRLRASAYEDFQSGLISKEDYFDFKAEFNRQKERAEKKVEDYEREIEQMKAGGSVRQQWIESFRKYRNIVNLSRNVVVELIDQIKVYEDKSIEVCFSYAEEFNRLLELSETKPVKGVV